MQLYVGVTDYNWYQFLAAEQPDELNFWQPGGRQSFKALKQNDMFLFKLHSPNNFIAGGGFFVKHAFLPVSLAWEAFGPKNGSSGFQAFRNAIHKYKKSDLRTEPDPTIGCIILSMPFFFNREDWIPVPEDWKPNIVQGKTYNTDSVIGQALYSRVQTVLERYALTRSEWVMETPNAQRYGAPRLILPRIGQGTFKIMVTEAYQRRCAITGEKTLPVLEAAHIKPYAESGPHLTANGLLLRRDMHALFDRGYITINPDLQVEISKRIKEDYGNGKEYYALHGKKLAQIPDREPDRPSTQFLQWHNDNVYLT